MTIAKAIKARQISDILFPSVELKVLAVLVGLGFESISIRELLNELKGTRNLGGATGLLNMLMEFETMGLVTLLDNNRSLVVNNEAVIIRQLRLLELSEHLLPIFLPLRKFIKNVFVVGLASRGLKSFNEGVELIVVTDKGKEVLEGIEQSSARGNLIIQLISLDEYLLVLKNKDTDLYKKIDTALPLYSSSVV